MVSPWHMVGSMEKQRMAAATVLVGDTIYVLGGSNEGGYIPDCEWSRVKESGNIGGWSKGHSLNTSRGYSAAVYYNGYLYVLGGAYGKHGGKLLNTVERARIKPDGSIGRWRLEEHAMFNARRGTTAVVMGGYLYAIGGYNGEFLDTVERARINKDGTLGSWDIVSITNERRYIHSTAVNGSHIYVMGGHHRASGGAIAAVEYASMDSDGELNEWQSSAPLNKARYGAAAFSAGGYIYVIGGFDGSALDSIERAPIGKDGVPGKWETLTPLSIPRNSPSVLVHDEHVFVIGGADSMGHSLSTIEAVIIDENGELTPWQS